ELDQRDRRLRGMVCCHTLESVGDEIARPPLRLAPCLLLGLPDEARELVADELLRALEQVGLRLVDGHPGDALELRRLRVASRLQIFLQLLRVHLAASDSLLAPRQLSQLAADLLFLSQQALLDLERLGAARRDLLFDLRA